MERDEVNVASGAFVRPPPATTLPTVSSRHFGYASTTGTSTVMGRMFWDSAHVVRATRAVDLYARRPVHRAAGGGMIRWCVDGAG